VWCVPVSRFPDLTLLPRRPLRGKEGPGCVWAPSTRPLGERLDAGGVTPGVLGCGGLRAWSSEAAGGAAPGEEELATATRSQGKAQARSSLGLAAWFHQTGGWATTPHHKAVTCCRLATTAQPARRPRPRPRHPRWRAAECFWARGTLLASLLWRAGPMSSGIF
jgi:hypothetical protein